MQTPRIIWQCFAGMLLLGSILIGCGDANIREVKAPDPVSYEPDTTGGLDMEMFEQTKIQRAKSGDTIAIAHEILLAVLPDSIAGFKLETDKAATFVTQNFTFSEASRVFYNEQEHYIELVAGDYIANPDFIEVMLRRYNLAQDVEIQGLRDIKMNLDPVGLKEHFFAWGSHNVARRTAHINVGVDFRYVISLSMTDVDALPSNGQIQGWLKLDLLP